MAALLAGYVAAAAVRWWTLERFALVAFGLYVGGVLSLLWWFLAWLLH